MSRLVLSCWMRLGKINWPQKNEIASLHAFNPLSTRNFKNHPFSFTISSLHVSPSWKWPPTSEEAIPRLIGSCLHLRMMGGRQAVSRLKELVYLSLLSPACCSKYTLYLSLYVYLSMYIGLSITFSWHTCLCISLSVYFCLHTNLVIYIHIYNAFSIPAYLWILQ